MKPVLLASVLIFCSIIPVQGREDNCKYVKDGLTAEFPDALKWGDCDVATETSAAQKAALKCGEVIADGNTPVYWGVATVWNWLWSDDDITHTRLPDTYLPYCGGRKGSGSTTTMLKYGEELKKALEELGAPTK